MGKLKSFDEHHLRPQVNQRGAKAFVRNALFDVNDKSPVGIKHGQEENNDVIFKCFLILILFL